MFLAWRVGAIANFGIFELVIRFSYFRAIAPLSAEITAAANSSILPARGYGGWAGQIVMSDDFDLPLEDLKEYM
ncbi:DUF2281 domain-containing protein [Tychonema sp. LEGE 07203]|uniref:DUF2281 domain-containing protein n=1 Tax=Tychonema sp. LEGE 07203 TaxID=1828671 RepID=UPI001D1569BC|nr:DUF2281 domain-containing protein [Tychonema sp. LEGE 07203]